MKIINFFPFVILCLSITLNGGVEFNFHYVDGPGKGFYDLKNYRAREVLEEAARDLGGWLDHDAVIELAVESYTNTQSGVIASASSAMVQSLENGFHRGVVAEKILNNVDQNGLDWDGVVRVNFAHSFAYGNNIGPKEIDFKGVMLHELTHVLGFVSGLKNIKCDNNVYEGFRNAHTYFDSFLIDVYGNRLIDENFELRRGKESPCMVLQQMLRFDGPQARRINGGLPILLHYDFTKTEGGSNFSHTLLARENAQGLMMAEDVQLDGFRPRHWNEYEIAVLEDIGYRMSSVPQCKPEDLVYTNYTKYQTTTIAKENVSKGGDDKSGSQTVLDEIAQTYENFLDDLARNSTAVDPYPYCPNPNNIPEKDQVCSLFEGRTAQ